MPGSQRASGGSRGPDPRGPFCSQVQVRAAAAWPLPRAPFAGTGSPYKAQLPALLPGAEDPSIHRHPSGLPALAGACAGHPPGLPPM